MKFRFKNLLFASLLPFSIASTVSCGIQGSTKEQIIINAKKGWWDFDETAFEKSLENELDNQFDIVFKNDFSTDKIVMNNLISGKSDLSFSSITQINLLANKKDEFVPKIQTLTNSFTFDPKWSNYLDGSSNDPLIKQAQKENQAFITDYPYQSNNTWNNSIYTNYYDTSKLVDFYRGNIWIYGSSNEIQNIKKAWNNKNWASFRNFGILHGETTSGGKFKLQESLLKKHFTKNGIAPFKTLVEEIKDHSSKFKNAKAKNLKDNVNYHIAFDDNGSFAYTPNGNDNGEKDTSKPFSVATRKTLETLVVTEPLKYDIGVFRKDFKYKNIVSNAILSIYKKGLDLYGPTYGYNGYRLIKPNEIETEVYGKWESVLGKI